MRIAFLVNNFPAITETFILHQITGMIDRGHDVDIFAPQLGDQGQAHPSVHRYKLMDRLHLAPTASNSRVGQLLAWLRHGIGAVRPALKMPWWLHRHRSTISISLPLLHRAFDGCGPYDITHCQFGALGIWGAWLREAGVPTGAVVTSFQGRDGYRTLPRSPRLHQWLFARGDLFLPVSEHLRQQLLRYGCSPDRAVVHHTGIRRGRFNFKPRTLPSDGPLRVITVGRLAEMKGIAYAVDAVARLRRSGVAMEHVIVGRGPLRAALQRRITDAGADDAIKLVGVMDEDALLDLLDRCHVMLHPSVTTPDGICEGIPNTVKEAMAVGMPVVSTFHAGIPELVTDGESGLLAPERDVDALIACLRRLIAEPDLWPRLTSAARRKIESAFDSETCNDELVRHYQAASGAVRS